MNWINQNQAQKQLEKAVAQAYKNHNLNPPANYFVTGSVAEYGRSRNDVDVTLPEPEYEDLEGLADEIRKGAKGVDFYFSPPEDVQELQSGRDPMGGGNVVQKFFSWVTGGERKG